MSRPPRKSKSKAKAKLKNKPKNKPKRSPGKASASVVIWHNPNCGTSRKVLEMIRARGVEPVIVEYLKTPPGAAEIEASLKAMGMRPRDLLRRKNTPYDELGLDDAKFGDAELVKLMTRHPLLIERPVVRTRKGTRLCRPAERLQEIL
ncbi:MAG: arsenate reductase (glutaredoxin) [Xanthobacteraceae bacterium]